MLFFLGNSGFHGDHAGLTSLGTARLWRLLTRIQSVLPSRRLCVMVVGKRGVCVNEGEEVSGVSTLMRQSRVYAVKD